MKIFNKKNLVLALACFLGISAVESIPTCSTDDDCDAYQSGYTVCDCFDRRLEEKPRTQHKPRTLRKANDLATAARNSKRGIEAAVGSRRAKSAKSAKGSKGTVKCPGNNGICQK